MKLNNKGFTVIELVISFSFVVVILASMFAIVINYENETDIAQTESNILVFKNTILQVVYQDIIANNTDSITSCGENCVLINMTNNNYKLELIKENNAEYLSYRDIKYLVPDSNNGLVAIDKFIYESDNQNKIYKVTIPVIHAELSDEKNNENKIEILVSGKKAIIK